MMRVVSKNRLQNGMVFLITPFLEMKIFIVVRKDKFC